MLQIVTHQIETLEIRLHQRLRFFVRDTQLVCQPESRQTIGQTIGSRLDLRTLGGADFFGGNTEHQGSNTAVQVLARSEGLDQGVIARHMRHQTHLNLGVIHAHQGFESGTRHESLPNLGTVLGAGGDVLQIRICRRKPPCPCHRLAISGVNPTVRGDVFPQTVHYLHQFRAVAVIQQRL